VSNIGTLLKRGLKARAQNIQIDDPGVYFILQLAGCKSINTANAMSVSVRCRDQHKPRPLGKA